MTIYFGCAVYKHGFIYCLLASCLLQLGFSSLMRMTCVLVWETVTSHHRLVGLAGDGSSLSSVGLPRDKHTYFCSPPPLPSGALSSIHLLLSPLSSFLPTQTHRLSAVSDSKSLTRFSDFSKMNTWGNSHMGVSVDTAIWKRLEKPVSL